MAGVMVPCVEEVCVEGEAGSASTAPVGGAVWGVHPFTTYVMEAVRQEVVVVLGAGMPKCAWHAASCPGGEVMECMVRERCAGW